MGGEKGIEMGAVQNDLDVLIARGPGIIEELFGFLFPERGEFIPEPVESLSQWSAPGLIPMLAASAVAAAVGHPPADPVGAAPGAFFVNPDFGGGWVRFEVFRVVGESGEVIGFNVLECVGQSHFAVASVVAVGFAVGGDMD